MNDHLIQIMILQTKIFLMKARMLSLDVPQEVVLPAICVFLAGFFTALDSADVNFHLPLLVDLLFVPLQVFGSGKAL